MSRYSGIVQSVEQRTVKFGAAQEKVSEKTAEICGFFNIYSPNTGYNFWKKVRVFYAVYCFLLPIFLQKLYADIRNTQTYVFAYAKLWCFYTPFFDIKFGQKKRHHFWIFLTPMCRNILPQIFDIKNPRKPRKSWLGQLDSNQ